MAAEKNNGTFPATRQGSRVHLAIPVFVYGSQEEGDPFQEVTDTLSVNAGGGLIGMVTPVKKGQKLLLVNLKTEERIQSSPRYWGVVFPPENWDSGNRKRPERQ